MTSGLRDSVMAEFDSELWRKGWRREWLNSIREIADFETQKLRWLDSENTNPHWSYVEYSCGYFDDLRLSEFGYGWAVAEGLLSQTEADAVQDFHLRFDQYGPVDGYDSKGILTDPQWHAVVNGARSAQSALRQLITDPEEIHNLLTGYS